MQLTKLLKQEELISLLFCGYFVLIILCKSLLRWARRSSIFAKIQQSTVESTWRSFDPPYQRDLQQVSRDSYAGENQFYGSYATGNQRNYADFLPTLEKSLDMRKFNVEEGRRRLFGVDAQDNLEDSGKIFNASTVTGRSEIINSVGGGGCAEAGGIIGKEIAAGSFGNLEEMSLDETLEQLEHNIDDEETKIICQRYALPCFTEVSYVPVEHLDDDKEVALRNEPVSMNTANNFSEELAYFQHSSKKQLTEAQCNFNENLEEHLKDPEAEFEARPVTKETSFEGRFKVSPVGNTDFRREFNKSSDKGIITLKESTSRSSAVCPKSELIEKAVRLEVTEEKYEISPRNENYSKKDRDSLKEEEVVETATTKETVEKGDTDLVAQDPEIFSQKKANYPDEQFGISPEKGTNCRKEKSLIHLSKNITQSWWDEAAGEEFGPPPDVKLLKNVREGRPTVSPIQPQSEKHGTEEEDLNAIIRRMIITELRKHREKEEVTMKRARSDTESLMTRKKNEREDRMAAQGFENPVCFQGFQEPGERPIKNFENASDNGEFIGTGFHESTETSEEKKDVAANDGVNGNSVKENFMENTDFADSNILLERKINLPSLLNTEEKESPKIARNLSVERECANKSTQTEHVYVIRAARSCPLRKKRVPLHFQLHRMTTSRPGFSSKTVYTTRDFSEFIFRKASDNLIYEKGKASSSPSYVPLPERFHWRYVTPTKV